MVEIRKFLNRKGSNGIAAVYATFDGRWGTVTITDCSRTISLDLTADNKQTKQNTLYKLDTLISVFNELRSAVAS